MTEIKNESTLQKQISVLQARLDNVNVIRKQTLELALLDLYQQINIVLDALLKENAKLNEEIEKLKSKGGV